MKNTPLLILLLVFSCISLNAKYHKAPITQSKVKGSIIDYMKKYEILSAENKQLKQEHKSGGWMLINDTSYAVELIADGQSVGKIKADTVKEIAPGERVFKRGDAFKLIVNGHDPFEEKLLPGKSFELSAANHKVLISVDFLTGKKQWFVFIRTK